MSIVPNAVSEQNRENLIDTIFEFLGVDRANPDSWYQPPVCPSGNVEIYQHQALWDNRQSPRVHGAFADIYNDHKLWVSLDRAAMRPPQRADQPRFNAKLFTHWDMDVKKLTPDFFAVQGVLCLNDAPPELGGFHRVCRVSTRSSMSGSPRIPKTGNRAVRMSRSSRPATSCSRSPRKPETLSSGICACRTATVTMFRTSRDWRSTSPCFVPEKTKRLARIRIQRWRERLPASWAPGDERGWEQKNGKTAELSPLGRKLLGLDLWDEES
jgi:hypothetical protein